MVEIVVACYCCLMLLVELGLEEIGSVETWFVDPASAGLFVVFPTSTEFYLSLYLDLEICFLSAICSVLKSLCMQVSK